MNSNNRIAATLYSLGTYVVWLRNISINTLHKGDDDDDDDNNNNTILYSRGAQNFPKTLVATSDF